MYRGLNRGDLRVAGNRAVNILEGTTQGQREQWKHAVGPSGEKLLNKALMTSK